MAKEMEILELNSVNEKFAFVPVPATSTMVGGVKAELTTDAKYADKACLKADGNLYTRTDPTLSLAGVAADAAAVGEIAMFDEYTASGNPIVEGNATLFAETYYHNATGLYTNDHGVQYRFYSVTLEQGAYYIYQNQEWTEKNSNTRLFEVVNGNVDDHTTSNWKQVWVSGDIIQKFRCPVKAGAAYVFQMSYHVFAGGTWPILWKASVAKKPVSQKLNEMIYDSRKFLKGYWGPNLMTTSGSTMYNALAVASETTSYRVGRIELEPGATYHVYQQNDSSINNNTRCFKLGADGSILGPQVWATNVKEFEFTCPDDGMTRVLQMVFNITSGKVGNPPSVHKWITGDSGADQYIAKRIHVYSKVAKPKLRILAMGNSYTLDIWSYIPAILKERGIPIDLSIFYRGSMTLQILKDEWNTTTNHSFYHWDTELESKWVNFGAVTPKSVLEIGHYDIITNQQGSLSVTDPSGFNVFADILDLMHASLDYPTIHGWTQTYTRKQYDDPAAALTNQKAHCEKYPFGIVFPAGCTVFNCRQNSSLASVSTGGDFWASDEVHLEEGLPCYAAACATAEAIFRKFYPRECILGDKVRPTWANTTAWGVANRQGTVDVGLTEANCALVQKAAILANNDPWTIRAV